MPAGAVGVHYQARVLNLLGEPLHHSSMENVLAQVHETWGSERVAEEEGEHAKERWVGMHSSTYTRSRRFSRRLRVRRQIRRNVRIPKPDDKRTEAPKSCYAERPDHHAYTRTHTRAHEAQNSAFHSRSLQAPSPNGNGSAGIPTGRATSAPAYATPHAQAYAHAHAHEPHKAQNRRIP